MYRPSDVLLGGGAHTVVAMESQVTTPVIDEPVRSLADRRMRKLLMLPEDAPKVSIFEAQNAFSRSIAISATRCLVTYVAIPLVAPVVDLTGTAGPILGLVLGVISMVAIFFAARRFFAADHKYRWAYAGVGAAIYVMLVIGFVLDMHHLLGS